MLVTGQNVDESLTGLTHARRLVVDTETTGLQVYGQNSKDKLCGIAVLDPDRTPHVPLYFPFRHALGENLPIGAALQYLTEMILSKKQLIMFNAPFDLAVLWKDGLSPLAWAHDVMNFAHLCNENEGRGHYGLSALGKKYIDEGAALYDDLFNSWLEAKLLTKGDIWRCNSAAVEPYACGDVLLTWDLHEFYRPHLDKQGLSEVAQGVSQYASVMATMMDRGLPIDLDVVERATKEADRRIHDCAMEVYRNEGRMVAINSPTKAAKWLGVESTEEKALERLVGRDDWRVNVLLAYRRAQRALGSYYRPLQRHTRDGRYHSDLSLIGTITGRPAFWGGSGKMNSLAIPRDTTSYRVKHAIVAPEGYKLLQADYKAAEMRLASHYGNEKRMMAILKSGVNVHQKVADDLGIGYDPAKRINFSVIYGIGAPSLARELDIHEQLAKRYLDGYHRLYPGFRRLYRDAERMARTRKYVTMWSGRRRHYNRGDKKTPYHKASDHIVQGSVGELIREKQTELHFWNPDIQQIHQVYDSAIMLIPEDEVKESAEWVRDVMTEEEKFKIPMEVDISVGDSMAEMEAV